jgi:hypothetical protein
MKRRITTAACLVAGLVLAGAGSARAGSADCSWTDLPLPGGARWATVAASDGHGTYVGTTSDDAVVLWRDGAVTTIGTGIVPADVNESGVVVGHRSTGIFSMDPMRWADGVWQKLAVPDGAQVAASEAAGNGDIYGAINFGRLIRWPADAPGTYQLLTGPFAGYADTKGAAADGTLIAWAIVDSSRPHAGLVWHPERGWTELANPGTDDIRPSAIAGDTIVGVDATDLLEWRAGDGSLVRTIPGATAADVNHAGQTLGSSAAGTTVWRAGDVEVVLPQVSGRTVEPVAIDEDGTVVGNLPWDDSVPPRAMTARCT